MDDYWEGMENDEQSIDRIRKSVKLLDVKEGQKVLDLGCYKMVAEKFMPSKCIYYGVDREPYNDNVIVRNFDGSFSFPFKFERILCLEVLEHLVYPQKTLRCIGEYLKEDGFLVVSLPNEATIWHRIRALFGTVDSNCFSENGKHLHLPSRKQALKFLQSQFSVISAIPYLVFPRGLGLLSKVLAIILQPLSFLFPSLFSRGTIFLCVSKGISHTSLK